MNLWYALKDKWLDNGNGRQELIPNTKANRGIHNVCICIYIKKSSTFLLLTKSILP